MTTISHRSDAPLQPRVVHAREGLKVSAYENVAGLLLALLVLVGSIVSVLLAVWLSNRVFATVVQTVPVVLEDVGGGREDGVPGESMELDEPDAAEIGRESGLAQPQMQNTLALVADAIAVRQADLDDPVISDEAEAPAGGGRFQGDGRQVGYGFGDGPPGLPRFKRWEIYFSEGSTLEEYAQQLDYFHIELGLVGTQKEVTYVFALSQPVPQHRTGPREQEKRLYMSWRQGSLKNVDRQLLARAGVAPSGLILQFYPPDIENRLAQMEVAFAGRQPGQIRKTRFGIRAQAAGFEFFVIDQTAI